MKSTRRRRWFIDTGSERPSLARFKILVFALIPAICLLLVLEGVQRVRYAITRNDAYWLLYGFASGSNRSTTIRRTPLHEVLKAVQREKERSLGRRYILCVGGSATYGVFNNPGYTFPELLNGILDKVSPGMFRVINAGMSGASSDEYRPLLTEVRRIVTSDVVLFYTGYNDIFIKAVNQRYQDLVVPAVNIASHWSLLFLTANEKYVISRFNRDDSVAARDRLRTLKQEFRSNLDGYVGELSRAGSAVILVPEVLVARQFGSPTNDYRHYARMYENIPTILKNVADAHGAEFVSVQRDLDSDDFKRNFIDTVHLTDDGNRRLAELLFHRSETFRRLVDGARSSRNP